MKEEAAHDGAKLDVDESTGYPVQYNCTGTYLQLLVTDAVR